jgi:hypothetical protein
MTKVIYTFYSVLRVGFAKSVWTERNLDLLCCYLKVREIKARSRVDQ